MLSVTGIIPTYNRAALVKRAVLSMITQTHPLERVIVVDDGSTDDTRALLSSVEGPVDYVRQPNAGGAAARNRGIRAAATPWLAFLDSDDVWFPDHIERLVKAAEATQEHGVLYFDDTLEQAGVHPQTRWERIGFTPSPPFTFASDATGWVMMHHQPMMLQSSLVRRDVVMDLGGLREDLRTAHDTHFFFRLGFGRPFCAVAGPGTHQTADDAAENRLTVKTGPVKLGRWVNNATLYEALLKEYPNLPGEYRSELRRRAFEANWRVARWCWRDSSLVSSMRFFTRAAAVSPGAILRKTHSLITKPRS